MMRHWKFSLFVISLVLAACSTEPSIQAAYDPASLQFDRGRASEILEEFVTLFPNRHSGQPNNRAATGWLSAHFVENGWTCEFDEWEIVNYSQPVALRNLTCRLPGQSEREILVTAHHDQFSGTIQGADNDGSGIAIMSHLGEIFGAEAPLPYSLVFVSTDAEEYGMIGSQRFIETHPAPDHLIAGISLDNLGKRCYAGGDIEMFGVGQFRGYGALWLRKAAQVAAEVGNLTVPIIHPPVIQMVNQAVPISGMDQGPMVAAGVPAFGFSRAWVDVEECDATFHTLEDTLEFQSPEVLEESGLAAEATVRQLLGMNDFPDERGPFLYSSASTQSLRGLPLWLIFGGFVAIFFVASYWNGGRTWAGKRMAWRASAPNLLSFWLPMIGGVLLLYALVVVGLLDEFDTYFGTSKDPVWSSPKWGAIAIFLIGLVFFFYLGRKLLRRVSPSEAGFDERKSLSFLVIGLGAVYVLSQNPFSLLFMVPILFWLLIKDRKGRGRILNIVFFVSGGLFLYLMLIFLGFVVRPLGGYVFWFLLMMIPSGMISLATMVAATAVIAAGLSLLVAPPANKG